MPTAVPCKLDRSQTPLCAERCHQRSRFVLPSGGLACPDRFPQSLRQQSRNYPRTLRVVASAFLSRVAQALPLSSPAIPLAVADTRLPCSLTARKDCHVRGTPILVGATSDRLRSSEVRPSRRQPPPS